MHYYMAAVYTNGYMNGQARFQKLNDHEKYITTQIPHILESYHYINKQKIVDEMRLDNAKVFLDSGAFSAYTLKAHIDITEYCDFIKRNWDLWRIDEDNNVLCSVLDGIGDPLQTYRNQLEMERQGVRPLPCFHFGEDERYLEWYMQHYTYITFGGMVGKSHDELFKWLDRIWDKYLLDEKGNAKVKIHAFGITNVTIVERYPWYSCDSSSWIQAASYGNLITPEWGFIVVSDKSPTRFTNNRHVTTYTEPVRDHVQDYLNLNGFDLDRLQSVYEARAVFNLWSSTKVSDKINARTPTICNSRLQGLF